jgi:arsenate reductase
VEIDVLTFPGCPHAAEAVALVRRVAQGLAPEARVAEPSVRNLEEARTLRFLGSPSVQVDGRDIEPGAREPSFSCRIYEGGQGVPPEWLVEAAVLRALSPKSILFLCVANSARSQMAEGLARQLAGGQVRIQSAGSAPSRVNPLAIRAMAEIGIDLSTHASKSVDTVAPASVDTVITLCAEEVCPVFLGEAKRVRWALPDPAGAGATEDEQLQAFRHVRDELRRRLAILFTNP